MKPGPRNGRLIRGSRQVGGGPRSSSTNYAQFGNLVADYNPANATSSGGRVTLVTEPVGGHNAQPNVAGAGPALNASNASYGNKPTFDFAAGNPVASDRLVTTGSLGTAIGNGSVTVFVVGHSVDASRNQHNFASNGASGSNYTSFYLDVGTSIIYMRSGNGASSGDYATTIACQTPCVFGLVYNYNSGNRFKKNQGTVGSTVTNLYSTDRTGGVFYIGNWESPDDAYVWNGSIARILVYSGDVGDPSLALVNSALQSEYSL